MHWLVYIGLIWAAIYVTSIVIAVVVNLLLPIPPGMAAASGLVGAMLGVFYYLFKYAEHPVQSAIDEIGRRRPGASIGDVVEGEDIGGIVEELRDQNSGSDEADEQPSAISESE